MTECSVKVITTLLKNVDFCEGKKPDYFNYLFWFDLLGLHVIVGDDNVRER